MAAVYAPVAAPGHGRAPPRWLRVRGERRLRRYGTLALRAGGARGADPIRMGRPRGEAAAAVRVVAPQTALCRQSSLGDGTRRARAAVGTCAPTRRVDS